ncbi:MAG TPA: Do family serine endopeptidase [Terriglobia bacterium]|nr:Do family serine endopeptidase [Terriglobia bacterium]
MSLSNRHFRDKNSWGIRLTLIGLSCAVALAAFYLYRGSHSRFVLAEGKALDGSEINALQTLNKAYERIAQSMTPAIVSIQSTQVVKVQLSPFFMDPFFRQFFGNQAQIPREQREHALGSGVLVTADGYILTNNHVIKNATSFKVMLSDKRTFTGKVVGADPQTDVAVVKIEAKELPTASLGNSSQLHVGDIVMAFGNPFGLNFTVTRGAVSALNRSEGGIEDIQNFIQTDAPINPGNSGGALVNVQGQVVGINTAILSGQSGPGGEGGFIGIGFAIPINMARHVMEDLVKTGKVRRGYLGAEIQSLNESLAHAFEVPDTSGALVQNVTPEGPADKAGLKNGDVIRKYNGQSVSDSGQLIALVTETDPGSVVTLDLLRGGKPLSLKVTIGERPSRLGVHAGLGKPRAQGTLRGITVQNLTADLREQLGVPAHTQGVAISDLDPTSPGAQSGLRQGDVIEEINRQPVRTVADFERLAAQAKGDTLVRLNRQGNGAFIVISPTETEGGDSDQ